MPPRARIQRSPRNAREAPRPPPSASRCRLPQASLPRRCCRAPQRRRASAREFRPQPGAQSPFRSRPVPQVRRADSPGGSRQTFIRKTSSSGNAHLQCPFQDDPAIDSKLGDHYAFDKKVIVFQSHREDPMQTRRTLLKLAASGIAAGPLLGVPSLLRAQEKPIRIGVLYDLSGPFAAAGSMPCAVGAQIAIDLANEHGGVLGKYKIEPIKADSQSKADVAINEAERLIDQEKVDIILGIYSSAHAVPLAAKLEAQKKILWITTAIASSVFKGKDLHYVFRAQIHSDQYGEAGASFLAENAKAKLGIEPKDLKVAVIYEDGPYGTGVAEADVAQCKERGITQVVLKEGYSASTPDLSSLVTKLKRARADVILHTGYNPDTPLFLRQSREAGLRFKMLIGNGAGYSQIDKLRDTFGADIDNFCNIDPVPAQLLKSESLAPGLGDLIKTMVTRYQEKTKAVDVPPHVSMGFNQTWILLNNVLPVAKEKYGSFEADSIRKAALDVDIPPGGTIQGYGVKFYPPGTPLAGQNERSTPVVMQNAGEHISVVWSSNIRTHDPVFPLPKSSIYAA